MILYALLRIMSAIPDDKKEHIIDLLKQGQKIEAIQEVRSEFGLSLKESRRFVDRLAAEHPELSTFQKRHLGLNKLPLIIGFIFDFVGTIFLGLAVWFYISTSQTLQDDVLVEGIVIDLRCDQGSCAPLIEYEFQNEQYTVEGSISSSPPAYEINEIVEVYVDPLAPDEPLINSFIEKWLLVTIFGGIGGVFFILGAALIFTTVIKRPK